MFSRENIIYHARRTELPESFIEELNVYISFINENVDVKEDLISYYNLLFESDTDIFPIIKVQDIPLNKKSEETYPGFFSTVVFLVAAQHFEKYLKTNNLYDLPFNLLDTYYKNVRRFMEMNYVRDNTYALLRHGYFLYGYAKPFSLRIGRLAYELREFDASLFNVFEVDGRRVFVANPSVVFNNIGYPEKAFEDTPDYVEGYIYNKDGEISNDKISLDSSLKVINKDETYITIHIPGDGKLEISEVEKSLNDAKSILKKVYKNYNPKQMMCTSWLLSPQLRNILSENSNILKFQELFDIVAGLPSTNAVYEHIFKCPVCPVNELKASNKFQQGILDIYLNNNELHSGVGVLKKEWNVI